VNTSPDEPQDEFVFDEKFIAAAKFKEPPAARRQGSRFARWRAERRRRAMARKPGGSAGRRTRRRWVGPRALTVLIVLTLVGLAVLLNYLDPFNVHPAPPKIVHTVAPPQAS
jgi:hypothetical protein